MKTFRAFIVEIITGQLCWQANPRTEGQSLIIVTGQLPVTDLGQAYGSATTPPNALSNPQAVRRWHHDISNGNWLL
jgi:hypothetical protein